MRISFDNSYARLPVRCFARVAPTGVDAPSWVAVNEGLAQRLGIDPAELSSPEGLEILSGNRVPEGADPLAMAYAGFQFGGWSPLLGDGRAILLGEVIDGEGGRCDIQLKGAGRTPFSHRGDGRAALGPVLREYLLSEGMAALGVPTTRALAAVLTGERVRRECSYSGAILTRVASSHVRVGTFQYFASRGDEEALRALADHVIARHYPAAGDSEQLYVALLDAVGGAQAELVARWQWAGFIHGVMNTDNTSVAGETLDYGPCAFVDTYHPDTVYSSIDRMGRYAYRNQPPIAHWNLAGLARALAPLMGDDPKLAVTWAQRSVDAFPGRYEAAYVAGGRLKLGLSESRPEDPGLIQELLACMAAQRADFTLTFRRLCDARGDDPGADGPARALFDDPSGFDRWIVRWRERLEVEGRSEGARRADMRSANPAYIPRNHRVEEVIRAAEDAGDLGPFHALREVLASPYEDQPGHEEYQAPPRPEEVVHRTYCGT